MRTKQKIIATACMFIAVLIALILTACSYQWLSLEEYAAMLKESDFFTNGITVSEYESLETKVEIDYGFDLPDNIEVREKYRLDEIAGEGDELSKTRNLLAWVSDKIKHDGYQNVFVPKETALHFLNYTYEKDFGINCKQLAITLSDCLRAVGIKARPVFIMPKAANSGDNHVITHVYIESFEKWIAVDPSYGATFRNSEGKYLNCFELRTEIANGGKIVMNEESHYNHNKDYSRETYVNYLAKNLYWFYEILNYESKTLYCIPDGFDVRQWYLDFNQYNYDQNYIEKDIYKQRKENYQNCNFEMASKELFLLV